MTSLADVILKMGEQALDWFLIERREETLHLEFKTLSSNSGLNREDRKMIAKAICGFCNAEGGLLVIGVETKRVDGIDTATALRPVRELNRLQNLVKAAVPEMLSPQHNGIKVEPVICAGTPDQGYILISVPRSDSRPHMSLLEQRYFRRGSDGTRVLEHGEVRELMFSAKEGAMEIGCRILPGASMGDLRFDLKLALVLQNVGRVPVSAP